MLCHHFFMSNICLFCVHAAEHRLMSVTTCCHLVFATGSLPTGMITPWVQPTVMTDQKTSWNRFTQLAVRMTFADYRTERRCTTSTTRFDHASKWSLRGGEVVCPAHNNCQKRKALGTVDWVDPDGWWIFGFNWGSNCHVTHDPRAPTHRHSLCTGNTTQKPLPPPLTPTPPRAMLFTRMKFARGCIAAGCWVNTRENNGTIDFAFECVNAPPPTRKDTRSGHDLQSNQRKTVRHSWKRIQLLLPDPITIFLPEHKCPVFPRWSTRRKRCRGTECTAQVKEPSLSPFSPNPLTHT